MVENIENSNEVKNELNDFRVNELNIQKFMNDMDMLGSQVNDKNLIKPTFHYGDLTITNYLLWLMLGELTILNNTLEDE